MMVNRMLGAASFAGVGFGSVGMIVGQAAPDVTPPIPTRIDIAFITVCLSLVGLVGWLMRHVFLTTIPNLQEENKAQREHHEKVVTELCKTHEATNQSNYQAFKATNEEERKVCAQNQAVMGAALSGLTTGLVAQNDRLIAEIGEKIETAMGAYRHETNEVLQKAVLDRELWLEKKKQKSAEEEHRLELEAHQRRGITLSRGAESK